MPLVFYFLLLEIIPNMPQNKSGFDLFKRALFFSLVGVICVDCRNLVESIPLK